MAFDLKDLGWDDDWSKASSRRLPPTSWCRRASPSSSTTSIASSPSRASCRCSTPDGCATRPRRLSAVGDWVAVRPTPGEATGTIEAILPRRSKFSRKVAGELTVEQIVAANIDTVFLVMGLDGDYNPRRLERYLLLAYESGARPVVILNKSDVADHLAEDMDEIQALAVGIPVHAISAKEQQRRGGGHRLSRSRQDRRAARLVGSGEVDDGQRVAWRGEIQDPRRARARFARPPHHASSQPDPAAGAPRPAGRHARHARAAAVERRARARAKPSTTSSSSPPAVTSPTAGIATSRAAR